MQVSRPRNETKKKKGGRDFWVALVSLPARVILLAMRSVYVRPPLPPSRRVSLLEAARAALCSPPLLVLLVSASRRANFCRNFWLEMFISETGTLPRSRGQEKRRGSITHHRPAINRLAQRATRRVIAMVGRERKRARVGFALALAMLAGAMLAGGARAGSTRRFLQRDPARMAERVESAEMITPFRGAGPYDIVREFYEWEYDNHTSRGYLFTPVATPDKKFPALVFGHGLVSPLSVSWLSSFLLTSDPLSTRREVRQGGFLRAHDDSTLKLGLRGPRDERVLRVRLHQLPPGWRTNQHHRVRWRVDKKRQVPCKR